MEEFRRQAVEGYFEGILNSLFDLHIVLLGEFSNIDYELWCDHVSAISDITP